MSVEVDFSCPRCGGVHFSVSEGKKPGEICKCLECKYVFTGEETRAKFYPIRQEDATTTALRALLDEYIKTVNDSCNADPSDEDVVKNARAARGE